MLYLIHGTNTKKMDQQAQHIVESLKNKREFAQVFYIHKDTFDIDNFEGLSLSQGLFFDKHIFVCRGLLQAKKEIKDYVLKNLQTYVDSSHMFLFVEEDLDKKMVDVVSGFIGVKVYEYIGAITEKEDPKKIFNIVHGYAELLSIPEEKRTPQQKFRVWQTIDSLRTSGISPEEFFGTLWWKYKTILQALDVSQKESGLAPYSYTQAKKLSEAYGERLKIDVSVLLDIYHEAHMGECLMWEELEGLVLK